MTSTDLVIPDRPDRTLEELAEIVNREHVALQSVAAGMMKRAMRLGEILIEVRARCLRGEWRKWADSHLDFSVETANNYMRVAHFKDSVPTGATIQEALQLLSGLPDSRHRAVREYSPEVRERARQLVEDEGFSRAAAARQLGVTKNWVRGVIDPEVAQRRLKSRQKYELKRADERRLAIEAERARKEQEHRDAVKRAARKAGGARAEAYAMGERFQDVIAQAHHEEDDREAREAWSRAGEHYRKMRDEIVRALGVS